MENIYFNSRISITQHEYCNVCIFMLKLTVQIKLFQYVELNFTKASLMLSKRGSIRMV